MTRIETIAIGDELLDGRITDRNASVLARELAVLGATPRHMSVVGDTLPDIKRQYESFIYQRPSLVIEHMICGRDNIYVFASYGPEKTVRIGNKRDHYLYFFLIFFVYIILKVFNTFFGSIPLPHQHSQGFFIC